MSRLRSFRRTMAMAAAAALATALLLTPGSPAASQEEFIKGSGRAEGRLIRVGPSAGRLSLAPVVGLTLADYLNTLGRGESRIADFAALDDSIPKELKDAIQPVRVESTDEKSEEGTVVNTPGTPPGSPAEVGGMRQSAAASDTPAGAS